MSSKTGSTRKPTRELCKSCPHGHIDPTKKRWDLICSRIPHFILQSTVEKLPEECPYHGLTHDQALIQIMIDKLENPHANDTTVTGYLARTR